MAYLNVNIPTIYAKVKKEYLYDLDEKYKKHSLDCVIFGMASITGRSLLFHCMLPNGACYWRLPISAFFQKSYDRTKVPDMSVDELELWNCFSYYPAVTEFDFLGGQRGKFLGKDKNFIMENIYLQLIGVLQRLMKSTVSILKYLKNISVHIYWLLITVILQLSLIIVFCGMLLTTLLITVGQTIRYKLLTGLLKIKIGSQKILTKCFMK